MERTERAGYYGKLEIVGGRDRVCDSRSLSRSLHFALSLHPSLSRSLALSLALALSLLSVLDLAVCSVFSDSVCLFV